MTNIIYLMADDLGFGDFDPAYMPRSHALMQSLGTQLDFQTAQNCAPTRAALMTGKDPSRFEMHGVHSPKDFPGLPVDEQLLPERLQDAGYATGIFGKWHLGLEEEQAPWNQGFDTSVGFVHGWINSYGVQDDVEAYDDRSLGHDHHRGHDMLADGTPIHSSQYATTLYAEAASSFIEDRAAAGEDFFAYVPFNAPHGPYSAPREYVDLYVEEFGITAEQYALLTVHAEDVLAVPGRGLEDADAQALTTLVYYAMVRAMDDAIADIYQSVVDAGVAGETLFMFASDNGHRTYPYDVGSSGDLRGGKGSPYEGGHRTANFIIWPEEIEAGETIDADVWVGDLNPTFLGIAGAQAGDDLQGVDVSAALRGEDYERPADRPIVPHIAKNQKAWGETSYFTVLHGDFKYIREKTVFDETPPQEVLDRLKPFPGQAFPPMPGDVWFKEELYDLGTDPGETTDLVPDPGSADALAQARALFENYGFGGLTGQDYMDSLPAIGPTGWDGYDIPLEWGAPHITSFDDPSIILYGSAADELFTGEADIDTIWGGDGDDTLLGLAGDDTLRGGKGADAIDGGEGVDTADYGGSYLGLRIDALRGHASTGEARGDTLTGIERIVGSARDDVILGTRADDTLAGGDGDDVLIGRAGNDTLSGEGGDDVLFAGTGTTAFDGGEGMDRVSYARAEGAVRIDLRDADASGGAAAGDSHVSIERLDGSAFGDHLIGGAGGDVLNGGNGDDRLAGAAGRDVLIGGAGADTLIGGGGADVFVFRAGDGDDVVRGFQDGMDGLRLIGVAEADLTIAQEADGTRIAVTGGSILLLGIDASTIDGADFLLM